MMEPWRQLKLHIGDHNRDRSREVERGGDGSSTTEVECIVVHGSTVLARVAVPRLWWTTTLAVQGLEVEGHFGGGAQQQSRVGWAHGEQQLKLDSGLEAGVHGRAERHCGMPI